MEIKESIESARGCGYRKEGGLYLIGGRLATPCGKLPVELNICPCCGQGIKRARGVTWISGKILEAQKCLSHLGCQDCEPFRSATHESKFMLMWVGEKFYPTPTDFAAEATRVGVSKRIHQIPKELVVGKTWVLLAHPKACFKWIEGKHGDQIPTHTPGIFHGFIPQRIEYIVKGDETEEELECKVKRGITLVKVIAANKVQLAIESQTH